MPKPMFVWSGTAWVSVATEVESLANFASLNYVNSYQPTFRNIMINGGFSIDQRNNGSSQTFTAAAALAYSVDRWYGYCTGANITGARVAGAAPSQFYYRFTGATSNTAVGFGQRIEAANSFHFANKTAVLSVNLASTSITSVTWTAFYANTTDTFGTLASPTRTQIATGTFTINSTLSRYSAVMNVPAAATTGIEIVFTTGALVASQTLTFDDVQFELGSSPTAFEQRPVNVELDLCKRYCQRYDARENLPGVIALQGWYFDANSLRFPLLFESEMRAAPTLTYNGTANTDYVAYSNAGVGTGFTFTSERANARSIVLSANKTSHGVSNNTSATFGIATTSGFLIFSSEL